MGWIEWKFDQYRPFSAGAVCFSHRIWDLELAIHPRLEAYRIIHSLQCGERPAQIRMPLNLANYQKKADESVKAFWKSQRAVIQEQPGTGRDGTSNSSGVGSGQNMDGFISLMSDLIEANGLKAETVIRGRPTPPAVPGFFCATKVWDMLVLRENRLVAALKFKSLVGSFGDQFDRCSDEAIGAAHDLRGAFRSGSFGEIPRPFVGWLMLVEDAPESRRPIADRSLHFPVRAEFQGASYIQRYDLLCKKLVQEQLYTTTTVIASPRTAAKTGKFQDVSEMTSLKSFVTTFAGHIAAEASR